LFFLTRVRAGAADTRAGRRPKIVRAEDSIASVAPVKADAAASARQAAWEFDTKEKKEVC
jgi:hypothetical protein